MDERRFNIWLSLLFFVYLEKGEQLRYSHYEYKAWRFSMGDIYAVILAAGKGTRMKSKLYKVLHPVCGKPMVEHVVDQVKEIKPKEIMVVVGYGAEHVREQLGEGLTYVRQEEQLGTGHAVQVTKEQLAFKQGSTLILCGDTPLITSETMERLIDYHHQEQAAVTILTTNLQNPKGYGRIIRDQKGEVLRIVEEQDASLEEQQVTEINTGIYCFDNQKLWQALANINNDNAQGEYYLTDCIQILKAAQEKVLGFLTEDSAETMGVNDRVALAEAEREMRKRINRKHMLNGVTIIDPEQTYIGLDVRIGQDTIIYPGTMISGQVEIGEGCIIGPNADLRSVKVGRETIIQQSVVLESEIGSETQVGPYAYIRPNSKIGDGCKIGDFVEIKNAKVGDQTKVPHLSYIGDAELGAHVNMGCGSITVNYDGQRKHKTIVEDGSFVGCNVNLVAPVTVGANAFIAAGSTITKSVPQHSLAIAREKQIIKENYPLTYRQKNMD